MGFLQCIHPTGDWSSDAQRWQLTSQKLVFVGWFFRMAMMWVSADPSVERMALLAFKDSISGSNQLDWNLSIDHCHWKGISCFNGAVVMIQLPGLGLRGQIPAKSLGNLPQLHLLNLQSNAISGSLPFDLNQCLHLQHLFLQNNLLSGVLPWNFSVWPGMRTINASFNNFSGGIPPSINILANLSSLLLQNNLFKGSLPDIDPTPLVNFSVANNLLSGNVPRKLASKFSVPAFNGNFFCGPPMADAPCNSNDSLILVASAAPSDPFSSAETPTHEHSKSFYKLSKSLGVCVIVVIGGAPLLFLLLISYVCVDKSSKRGNSYGTTITNKSESSLEVSSFSGLQPKVDDKLPLFKDSCKSFDFDSLLRASADILGKGFSGSSYKAVLEDGSTVVVKCLQSVNNVLELKLRFQALGRLCHPNILPPAACYFSNDEKLLVYDYLSSGSLCTLLHGSKEAGQAPLDWVSRVRIALGAARGIAYLHEAQGTPALVHGNIKSSNILIEKDYKALVSDFGLLHHPSEAPSHSPGYKAPEVTKKGAATQKSDVYSFGVLLLELLTGKCPIGAPPNDERFNLGRWVQLVIREEWTGEVFDVELMRYQGLEEEMVQMLQIALGCIAAFPNQRPSMNQVIEMIEEIQSAAESSCINILCSDKSEERSVNFDCFASSNSPISHNTTSYIPTSVTDQSEERLDLKSHQRV